MVLRQKHVTKVHIPCTYKIPTDTKQEFSQMYANVILLPRITIWVRRILDDVPNPDSKVVKNHQTVISLKNETTSDSRDPFYLHYCRWEDPPDS